MAIANKTWLNHKITRFLMGGVTLSGISFINNYIFVHLLHWPVRPAYLLTLIIDFSIGFLINRFFVFKKSEYQKTNKNMFTEFVVWGLSFRALNWLIYILIVENLGWHTTIAQGSTIAFLLIFKFFVFNRIFK